MKQKYINIIILCLIVILMILHSCIQSNLISVSFFNPKKLEDYKTNKIIKKYNFIYEKK